MTRRLLALLLALALPLQGGRSPQRSRAGEEANQTAPHHPLQPQPPHP